MILFMGDDDVFQRLGVSCRNKHRQILEFEELRIPCSLLAAASARYRFLSCHMDSAKIKVVIYNTNDINSFERAEQHWIPWSEQKKSRNQLLILFANTWPVADKFIPHHDPKCCSDCYEVHIAAQKRKTNVTESEGRSLATRHGFAFVKDVNTLLTIIARQIRRIDET